MYCVVGSRSSRALINAACSRVTVSSGGVIGAARILAPGVRTPKPLALAPAPQTVSAAVNLLMSVSVSSDFTISITDSDFCFGHFAKSALPRNFSATSS